MLSTAQASLQSKVHVFYQDSFASMLHRSMLNQTFVVHHALSSKGIVLQLSQCHSADQAMSAASCMGG